MDIKNYIHKILNEKPIVGFLWGCLLIAALWLIVTTLLPLIFLGGVLCVAVCLVLFPFVIVALPFIVFSVTILILWQGIRYILGSFRKCGHQSTTPSPLLPHKESENKDKG